MKTNALALCLLALSPVALVAQAFSPSDFAPPDSGHLLLDSERFRDAGDFRFGDHLIPRKGKTITTIATGIPYVGIAEAAYGFTDRFSVGLVVGVLANSAPGYGLRFRYLLAQPSPDLRVYIRMPVLYYPRASSFGCPDCDPWFLTWPAVNAEWRRANGTRLWWGVGVVAAACATTVFGGEDEEEEMAEGLHEGTWNTLQFGFSRPLKRRISFQLEVAVVFKGLKLATPGNWLGGPPVILTTGLSYAF